MNRLTNSYICVFIGVCVQGARDAKLRREKTEEEVNELNNKSKTLEVNMKEKCNLL